jgi:hypothetical protein
MQIRITLRNGNRYLLLLEESDADPEQVFGELAAGRSQALRGWVAVESQSPHEKIVVLGEEIVELHLLDENPAS